MWAATNSVDFEAVDDVDAPDVPGWSDDAIFSINKKKSYEAVIKIHFGVMVP